MLKIENRGCHGTGIEKSFNLNVMLGFTERAVGSIIKTVWWASKCFSLT